MSMKNSNDTSWDRIRFVAQHLSHCATAVSIVPITNSNFTSTGRDSVVGIATQYGLGIES